MAKTKTLISCAATAQLICVFVFAFANCWFSHAAAHFNVICSCLSINPFKQSHESYVFQLIGFRFRVFLCYDWRNVSFLYIDQLLFKVYDVLYRTFLTFYSISCV